MHMEQERLRRKKEQLATESELAATSAKLSILGTSEVGSARGAPSDGMNSYCSREIRSQARHTNLPQSVLLSQQSHSTSLGARPKESKHVQTQEHCPLHQLPHTLSSRQQLYSVTLNRTTGEIMFLQLIPHMETQETLSMSSTKSHTSIQW